MRGQMHCMQTVFRNCLSSIKKLRKCCQSSTIEKEETVQTDKKSDGGTRWMRLHCGRRESITMLH